MAFDNLYQVNSLESTFDDDFSKEKILQGAFHALKEYKNYIEESLKVIQRDGAFQIPLKTEKNIYYLDLYNFVENEKQSIIKYLSNVKKTKAFYSDGETLKVKKFNKENLSIELNTPQNVTKIYIKIDKVDLDKKTYISLDVRHFIDFDSLNNKNAKKVEKELFVNDTKALYSEKPSSNHRENIANKLWIKNRNVTEKYIIFNTYERFNMAYVMVNDYQLQKQKQAIDTLMNKPQNTHAPLQKLFDLSWKAEEYFDDSLERVNFNNIDWKILNQPEKYDGTDQQQNFVRKALKTKDFALLEGPPGSGKTTAIIELIIQLIKQKKRVLLVSATHIAVDNVIHRILTTYKEQCDGLVVPIRISSNVDSVRQESVEPYLLKTFVENTKEEIKTNLRKNLNKTSKKTLFENLKKGDNSFDDIILKSANLVGGTMIGILQHPDIKKGGIQEMFDVMIVDESSKVTFLDFIVPALYAKKWILVGDVNQLSPYTEDDFINENIDLTFNDKLEKQKLVQSFELKLKLAPKERWNKGVLKILFSNNHTKNDFPDYEVVLVNDEFNATLENIIALNSTDIVICKPADKVKKILAEHIFVKTILFNGAINLPQFKNRQNSLHQKRNRNRQFSIRPYEFSNDRNEEWKELVGNRLSQMYQYRFEPSLAEDIKREYDFLVPINIQSDLEKIRRIALPSILELLQIGVGKKQRTTKNGKTYVEEKLIYEGFNQFPAIKQDKFQTLTYQHRMHDEIASISRKHFYKDENLTTANTVYERKDILEFYKPNEKKVIWVSNADSTFKEKYMGNINPTEIANIKSELVDFMQFSKNFPKKKGELYEIAILTFYREQERELKKMLQLFSGQEKKSKAFTIGNVKITLSTVDKFQGDEADMVLLSFTKFTRKAFYNSPNRLNVALTRARYKLVLFGNKNRLAKRAQSEALNEIAENQDRRIII